MTECFCGCGRKIGALAVSRKSANKVGRVVHETLAQVDALGARLDDQAKMAEALNVPEKLKLGPVYEQDCRAVVHEERDFKAVNWPEIRAWVRDLQGMVSFLSMSREQQQEIARRS